MSTAFSIDSPNTGTTISAQITSAQLWSKAVQVHEQNNDYWLPFEGSEGSDNVITAVTDTAAGAGQKITFRKMAGLYAEPHEGDEQFDDDTDFEALKFGQHSLTVDWLRHAVRYTERAEDLVGIRGEISSNVPEQLGSWLGRIRTERLDMRAILSSPSANRLVANGHTFDTLVSADSLNWNQIVALGAQMQRLNGKPAMMATRNGQQIPRYLISATKDALYSLETDSTYQSILQYAGERGGGNDLFSGEYSDVRGHIIRPRRVVLHDGNGPLGSPLNPIMKLAVARLEAATTLTLLGHASNTTIKYTKWFPGYAYRLRVGEVVDPTSLTTTVDSASVSLNHPCGGVGTYYALVVNPPDAAVDPGKVGMISYTASQNDGNKITFTSRLSDGIDAPTGRHTTVGAVTYNSGWPVGTWTDNFAVGALVIPCNSKGQAWGISIFSGANAFLRGYGKYRRRRDERVVEPGFSRDVFMTSVFGQDIVKDAAGNAPGFSLLIHAIKYAGVPLPTVT